MDLAAQKFYNDMSDYYHLIFSDWDKSIERQSIIIENIFKQYNITTAHTILDCACGIGTQALGLAKRGYRISGSDISEKEVERAKKEAKSRELNIDFFQADFCELSSVFNAKFDVIIAMDNALPHLTKPEFLKKALFSIYSQIEKGGTFIASIRDYDDLLETKPSSPPPYIIDTTAGKRIAFQIWDWHDDIYEFTQYIIEDEATKLDVHKFQCCYRAITRSELTTALSSSGFHAVQWLMPEISGFYQPIVIARK